MTVQDAITKAKGERQCRMSDEALVELLSDLDGQIFNDIISRSEGADEVAHGPYTVDDDMDTELVAPAPYANDLYVEYLKARINLDLSETAKYNNGMIVYQAALASFSAYYNRTHTPLQSYYIRGCMI